MGKEAKTLDNALSSCKYKNFASLKRYQVCIVDEKSMVKAHFWTALSMWKKYTGNTLRFVVVGSWDQLPPVRDAAENLDYENSLLIHELCAGRMLKLTKCRRAADDAGGHALFNQYKDMKNLDVTKFGQEDQMFSIAYYNQYINHVNFHWMNKMRPKNAITARALPSFKVARKCQDMWVYVGLPLMACITRANMNIYNSERWVVQKIKKDVAVLESPLDKETTIVCPLINLANYFRPGYCTSVFKSQGATYRFKYAIHEWNKMDEKMRYVAVSRGTTIEDVNILDREASAKTKHYTGSISIQDLPMEWVAQQDKVKKTTSAKSRSQKNKTTIAKTTQRLNVTRNLTGSSEDFKVTWTDL
jgi:ATP-dependent exoDNAse (exonuclease V) alpha subunit